MPTPETEISQKCDDKVDFLVAGNEPGSKADKAGKLDIHVPTEAEWRMRLSAGPR